MRKVILTSLGLVMAATASVALVHAAQARNDGTTRSGESSLDRALFAGPLGAKADEMRGRED